MSGGWTTHRGKAVGLPHESVDTDQIIPARFMSAPRSEGYGGFLLYDVRRDADGALRTDMAINTVDGASILVARRNFGGGSSREAAVYALVDAGFRAVLAPSFGDIFIGNAVNNGLLPALISDDNADCLLAVLANGPVTLDIDLETATISTLDTAVDFAIDPIAKTKLINGWDDIDLTSRHANRIVEHRDALVRDAPWTWPHGHGPD